jgi:hypothetical protein
VIVVVREDINLQSVIIEPGPDCAHVGRCLLELERIKKGFTCCERAAKLKPGECRFWGPPPVTLDSEIESERCLLCPVVAEVRKLRRETESQGAEISQANNLAEHYKHKMRDLARDLRSGARACTEVSKMLSAAASTV